MNSEGFYRRPLPEQLISFSSTQGREVFREALASGGMEAYFTLAEQFHTQSEPAFCGLGTLVVVLNALSIDPGRVWKGVWRWYGEEFLDCCQPLSQVKEQGITFDEFVCLARCNGLKVEPFRYDASTLKDFRETVSKVTSLPQRTHIVVSYSRQGLGQTGDGHFSPLAGYHRERDLVLLLDVARFKYPPHWVPLSMLWEAFAATDSMTGKCRGYILLQKEAALRETFFLLAVDTSQWMELAPYFQGIIPAIFTDKNPASLEKMVEIFVDNFPLPVNSIITNNSAFSQIEELLLDIRSNKMFEVIQNLMIAEAYASKNFPIASSLSQNQYIIERIVLLLLACPEQLFVTLSHDLQSKISHIRALEKLPHILGSEVSTLQTQMAALQELWLSHQ
ncbi:MULTISPECIES: phytochelatin synthase family protein [Aerosakkonema]|uniref:phytochelatin synthase family protein n=1 Tax=Aerosakkonema TaxID=1246629 RepID=UPI0035B8E114